MTLSSTATKVTYNGDGSTTVFAVNFVFWNSVDLRVIRRNASGTETVWTEGTHYTVTGGAGGTGSVTVKTSPTDHTPAAGETLTIKDEQAETQGDSLPLSGAFPSTVIEQRFDKITRLIQIHSEEIARSILLPETASLSGLRIPEPGAGELVRYNAAGTSLETVVPGDINTAIDTLTTGLAADDFLRWDAAQSAWVNIPSGSTGRDLLGDNTATEARGTLALGTAAVVNTGVANGQAPLMDATGYPAADGSRITNVDMPRGYIDGLTLSNNTTDAAKDIDIAAGVARDDTNAVNLVLAATLVKQIDASWAVGTNAGGLDGTESVAGTPDANTWYHVWLIRRSDTGVVDVLFSESATAPTMPAVEWDQKRRIGAVLTDATPDIVAFHQFGDTFFWDVPVQDYDQTNPGTAAISRTLAVPTGLVVQANHIFKGKVTSTGQAFFALATALDQPNTAPSASIYQVETVGSGAHVDSASLQIRTDTSAQIRTRLSNSAVVVSIAGITEGWIDPRGRNA